MVNSGGTQTLTHSSKTVKPKSHKYVFVTLLVLVIFRRKHTTGHFSCFENANSAGLRFESPISFSLDTSDKCLDELNYEKYCPKLEFSEGWIVKLAGKSVRKR